MRLDEYRKTGEGPLVSKDDTMDLDRKRELRIERFDAFFEGIPLWGGREWKTLRVDEIVPIFRGAADDILVVYQQRHQKAVREHSMKNRLARWWLEFRGWKAPRVPSREEVVQDMATRCKDLSTWMKNNSSRPFYADSDMSVFIHKPAAVAEQLLIAARD